MKIARAEEYEIDHSSKLVNGKHFFIAISRYNVSIKINYKKRHNFVYNKNKFDCLVWPN